MSLVDSDDQPPASTQQSSVRFVNYRPVEMDPRAPHILNRERRDTGSCLDFLQSYKFLLGFLLVLALLLVYCMRQRGKSRGAKDKTKSRIPNYQRTDEVRRSSTSLRPQAPLPRSASARPITATAQSTLTSVRSEVAPTRSPLYTTRLSLTRHSSTSWTLVGRSVGSKETLSKKDSKIPWLRRWCFPIYSPLKAIHTCLHLARAATHSRTLSMQSAATQAVSPTARPSTAYLSPQSSAVASQPSSSMSDPKSAVTPPPEQPVDNQVTRSCSRSTSVEARGSSTKAKTDAKHKYTTKLDITVVESASARADSRRERRQPLVLTEITPSQHESGQQQEDRIHDSTTLSSAQCDHFATDTAVSAYIMPRSDQLETIRTHKKGQLDSDKKVREAKKITEDLIQESTDRVPGLTMDRFKKVECLKATEVTDKLFFSYCDSDICPNSETDAQLKYQTKFGQSLSKCQKTTTEVEMTRSSQQPAAESRGLLQKSDTEQDQHTTISSLLCADDAVSDLLSGNLTSTCRKVYECSSVYSHQPALKKEPHAHRNPHRAAELKSNLRAKMKLEEIEEVSETVKDTDECPASSCFEQGSQRSKSDGAFSSRTSPPTTTTQLHATSPFATTNSDKKRLRRGKTPVDELPRKRPSDGANKKTRHRLTYLSLAPEICLRLPKKVTSRLDGPLAELTFAGRGQQGILAPIKPNVAEQSNHYLLGRDLCRKRSHKAREFSEMKGCGSSNKKLVFSRDGQRHAGAPASPQSGKPRARTPPSLPSDTHQLKPMHQHLRNTMYTLPSTEPGMIQDGKQQKLARSRISQDNGDARGGCLRKQMSEHQRTRCRVPDDEGLYQDGPGDRGARSFKEDRIKLYVAHDGARKIALDRKMGLPVSTPDQSISDSIRHVSDWLASLSQENEYPRGRDLHTRGKNASLAHHPQTVGPPPNASFCLDEGVTSVQDEEIARQLTAHQNATHSSHLTNRAPTDETSQVASLRFCNKTTRKTTRDNGVSRELLYSSSEVNGRNQRPNKVGNRENDRRELLDCPTSYPQKPTSKSPVLLRVSPEPDVDRHFKSNRLSRRRLEEAVVARHSHPLWPGKFTLGDDSKLPQLHVMDIPSHLPAPGGQRQSGCLPTSSRMSSASEKTVSEPLTAESSNFAQIPLFTNKKKESVNIIVPLGSDKHGQMERNTLDQKRHQTPQQRVKSRVRGARSPVLGRFGSRHSPDPTDGRLQAVSFSKSRMISRNKENPSRTTENYSPSPNQQLTQERSTNGSICNMRHLDREPIGFGHTRFYHLAHAHMSPRKMMSTGLSDLSNVSRRNSYLGIKSVPRRITRLSGLSSLEDKLVETKAWSGHISLADALSETRLSDHLDKRNLSEEDCGDFNDVHISLHPAGNRLNVRGRLSPKSGPDIIKVPKKDPRFKSLVSQRRAPQSKSTGLGQFQTNSAKKAAGAGQDDTEVEHAQEPILEDSLSPTQANTSIKEMLKMSNQTGRIHARRESDSIPLATGQRFKCTDLVGNCISSSPFQGRAHGSCITLTTNQKKSQACDTSGQAPELETKEPPSIASQTLGFKNNGIDSRPVQQEACSSLQPSHQQSAVNPRPDTQYIGDCTLVAKNSTCGNREMKLQGEESMTNDNCFEQKTNYKTNDLTNYDQRLSSQKYVKSLANEKYSQTVAKKKDHRQAAHHKDQSHRNLPNQRQLPRVFSPGLATQNRWKQSATGVKHPVNTTENRSCADPECASWHQDTCGRVRHSAVVFQSRQQKLEDAGTSESQFSDLDEPFGSRGSPGRTTSIQSRDGYKNQQEKEYEGGYKLSTEEFETFPVVGHAHGQTHLSGEDDKGKNLSYTDYAIAKEQTVQLEHPKDLRSFSRCSTQFSDVETLPSNVSPQGNVFNDESQTVATSSAKGRDGVHQPATTKQKRYFHSFSSSPDSRNEREKLLSDHNKELKLFTSERKHVLGNDRLGSYDISKMFKIKENSDLKVQTAKMDMNAAIKAHVLKFNRVSGLSTSSAAMSLNQAWTEMMAKISPRQVRLAPAEASTTLGADSAYKSLTQSKHGHLTHGQSCLLRKLFRSCLGPATSLPEHGERESAKASVTRLHKYQPRVAKIRSLHKLMNARSRSGHLIRKADMSLRRTHSFCKSVRRKYDGTQRETTGQHSHGLACGQQHDNNTSSYHTISNGSYVVRSSGQPEEDDEISAKIASAFEDFSKLSGRVFDEKEVYSDDCCLPDRLPSKIDGSTDGSSRSDVSVPQAHESLHVSGRPKSFTRTLDCNLVAASLSEDPIRDRYLQELTATSSSVDQKANKGQQNYSQDTHTTVILERQQRMGQETTAEKPTSCTLSAPLSKVSDLTRSIQSSKTFQPSTRAIRPGVKRKWSVDELQPAKTQAVQGSQNLHGHQRHISNTSTKNNTDMSMNLNTDRPVKPRDTQREAVSSLGGQSHKLVQQMGCEIGDVPSGPAQISKSNSGTSGSGETNIPVSIPTTYISCANEAAQRKQLRGESAQNDREDLHPPSDLGDDMNMLQETSDNISAIEKGGSGSTQAPDGDIKVKNASYTVIRAPDSHAKTTPEGEARSHDSQGTAVLQPPQGDQHPNDTKTGSRIEGRKSSYQTTAGATVHLFKRQKLFPTPVNKKPEAQTNSHKIRPVQRRSLQQTEPSSVDPNDIGLNKIENVSVRHTSTEGVKKSAMDQARSDQRKNGSGPEEPTDLPAPQHTAETSSSNTDVALSWVAKSVTHETHDSEEDSLPVSVCRPDPPPVTLSTVCGYLGETPHRDHGPALDKFKREDKDQDDVRNDTLVDTCQHEDGNTERVCRARNTHKADFTNHLPDDEKLAFTKQPKTPFYHGQDVPAAGAADSLLPFWAKKPQLGCNTAPKGRTKQSFADEGRINNVATNHTQEALSQPKLPSKKTTRESVIGAWAAKANKQIIPQGESRRATQSCGRELKFAQNQTSSAPAPHNNSKSLAKNRRYVSSALMYTMKKQNAQHKTTRKEAALSTNNSAQSDRANPVLPPQTSSRLPLFNLTVNWEGFRALPEHTDQQQTVANHKFPITYRLSLGNANNDASITLACESPNHSSSQSDSSYKDTTSPARQDTEEAATDSLNRDTTQSYLKQSTTAINSFNQALPKNNQVNQIATVDPHVVETTNSAEERDGDSSESKSLTSSDNLPIQSGSSLRVANSRKVKFDWYKPSANRVSRNIDTRSSHGSRTGSSQVTGELLQAVNEEQGLPDERTQPTHASDVQHSEFHCPKFRLPPQQRRHPHVCCELAFPPDVFTRTPAAASHSSCSKRHTHKQTCTCMLPQTSVQVANSPQCSTCFKDLRPLSYGCPDQTSRYCHEATSHNTSQKMTLSSELGEHLASRAATVRPISSKCFLPAQLAHSNTPGLNQMYQSLQQGYKEADPLYHSNWVLANQNIATQRLVKHNICCNRSDNKHVPLNMPLSSYEGASLSQPLCPCTYFSTPLFSNCPTPDLMTSVGDTSPNYFSDSLHERQPEKFRANENIFLVDDCCCAPSHLSGLCPATPTLNPVCPATPTLNPVVHPNATSWLHPMLQQSISTSRNLSSSSNPTLTRAPDQCICFEAAWFQNPTTTISRANPSYQHYPDNATTTSLAATNNQF